MIWLSLFLVISVVRGEDEAMSAKELTEANFKDEVGSGPHFVMFFAPWCGHCKRLAPTWEELAVKYNKAEDKEATIGKVDCTQETALCSAQDVTGYPTLKFFKDGFEKENGVKYRGNRDFKSLDKHIQEQLGKEVPEEAKAPESAEAVVKDGLTILTSASFTKELEKGDVFVKFYAPWCGHCIKLAPTWDDLAKALEKDETVKIAKIDCTDAQSVCQENGVQGYPTLAYFRNGQKVETYRGARNLADLKDFVEATKGNVGGEAQEDGKVPAYTPVLKLDKSNFEEEIKEGVVFVKFFAPWCGHCKSLAPTWEKLADAYKEVEGVKIAHVDCTADGNANQELCNGQGVNGFPTLNMYKDGVKVEEYEKKRTLEDLKAFVEKHTAAKPEEASEDAEAKKEDAKDEL